MVAVSLYKIIMHENQHDQIIILKEKDGDKQLPIVIGVAEAASIKLQVSNIRPPRPLTHDLLTGLISKLGATLEKVIIHKLENSTFYAKLILTQNDKQIDVDARPSDGVAIALRANVPIFVEEEVFLKMQSFNG